MARPAAGGAVLLSVLAALGACADAPPTAPEASAEAPAPRTALASTGGTWVSGTWYSAYGARFYRLYVPSGYTGGSARPLMVMLHGCSQDGYDFAGATRMNSLAEARNFLVLYPEQGTLYNGADCWNWFLTANQFRGAGEPAVIAGMIGWVKSNYAVNASRVGVAGFSAGAGMASVMACAYPDHVRSVASVAGVMYRAATTSGGGTYAMLYGSTYSPNARGTDCDAEMGSRARVVPALVIHGSSDGTVNPVNGAQTAQQWTQALDLAHDGVDDGDVDYTADATASGTACRSWTRRDYRNAATGQTVVRHYVVNGLGHRWPGGASGGSFADPCGPDASTLVADWFGF